MYKKTTFGITIYAEPIFVSEQSSAEHSYFVWAYNIRIENNSENTVQLLHRFWRITDAFGSSEEIDGPGVIGEQPVLKSGQIHQYTSGTHLKTSSGIMSGSYQFENLDCEGEFYEVEIPAFSLDSPFTRQVVN